MRRTPAESQKRQLQGFGSYRGRTDVKRMQLSLRNKFSVEEAITKIWESVSWDRCEENISRISERYVLLKR